MAEALGEGAPTIAAALETTNVAALSTELEAEAEEEAGTEIDLEVEADGDAKGRRWRMPNTGGTIRLEHGDGMGCCSGGGVYATNGCWKYPASKASGQFLI
ncbi:hypothetical protein NW769_000678 [Fusarium oxysporum]|jgi:hypothetical protein|nr:hypothetical protein NW769_000678 [Fusarium oxysporum]